MAVNAMEVWILVVFILCGLLWISTRRRRLNLPPGPVGLPIVGYLPFLGKEAYKTLHNLSAKYGSIYSLHLGRQLVVVLNSIVDVKEALQNPNIMERPPHPPNHLLPNSISLSVSNGAVWKEQRNFAVQVLRKFGMGKDDIQERIKTEILRLEQEIDSRSKKPMDLSRLLLPSVSNVMLSLLSADQERMKRLRNFLDSALWIMTLYFRPTRVHAYFPYLRKWMVRFHIWGYDKVEKTMKTLSKIIESEIDYHRSTLDPDNIRDYIDAFLIAQRDRKNNTFTDSMLRGNFQSLLGAGSTPARAALEWCLLAVAMYPGVQEKVYQEVFDALNTRRPNWSDRHDTPYAMAVILESMRHHTVIPISMLRTNSRPCLIHGYDIPQHTIIMTNIWGVHHDPAQWEEPQCFKPERLIKDGKIFKPAAFIPFSYGKRNCPGEDLAMMEVYMYFVSLVQRYEIKPASRHRGFRNLLGIANMAVPDNVIMKPRPRICEDTINENNIS